MDYEYEQNFKVDASIFQYAREELSVRLLQELSVGRTEVIHRTYYEGGEILYAIAGDFRLTVEGAESQSFTLSSGEWIFIYPHHFATVKAVRKRGRLRQLVLNGAKVDQFFGSIGIYHGFKFAAEDRPEVSEQVRQCLELDDQHGALSALQDALSTEVAKWQQSGNGQLANAIRIMLRSIQEGNGGLKSVCEELGISRATLHRLFVQAGLKSPGDFLRRERYRIAYRLLTATTLPIGEIADRVGCSSNIYFNEFVKRCSGMTPGGLRQHPRVK